VALASGWVTILLYCLWLNEYTYFSNNISLLDDHSKESEKEDSWYDVSSCDFYFQNMV
jgi:hypothetical protein